MCFLRAHTCASYVAIPTGHHRGHTHKHNTQNKTPHGRSLRRLRTRRFIPPSNPPSLPRDGTSTMRPSSVAFLLALAAGSSASPPGAHPALRRLQDGSRACHLVAVIDYDPDAPDDPDVGPVGRRLTAGQKTSFYCTDPEGVAPPLILDLTTEQVSCRRVRPLEGSASGLIPLGQSRAPRFTRGS